jgi:hypothetical protein
MINCTREIHPRSVVCRQCQERALSILKEASVKMTQEWKLLTTSAFITNITVQFILGLNVMHAHDASVKLKNHVL